MSLRCCGVLQYYSIAVLQSEGIYKYIHINAKNNTPDPYTYYSFMMAS